MPAPKTEALRFDGKHHIYSLMTSFFPVVVNVPKAARWHQAAEHVIRFDAAAPAGAGGAPSRRRPSAKAEEPAILASPPRAKAAGQAYNSGRFQRFPILKKRAGLRYGLPSGDF